METEAVERHDALQRVVVAAMAQDKAQGGKSVPAKVTVNGKRNGGERSGGNVKKKHKK